jgi:hypothetical protein
MPAINGRDGISMQFFMEGVLCSLLVSPIGACVFRTITSHQRTLSIIQNPITKRPYYVTAIKIPLFRKILLYVVINVPISIEK